MTIRSLGEAVEQDDAVSDAGAVISALQGCLPGFDLTDVSAATFGSTDAMLLLVDRVLPGWTISIDGVASIKDGHWVCVLRNAGERDNDAYLGIGKSASLAPAILAAMLKALAHRA